jgi:hypothetical protein
MWKDNIGQVVKRYKRFLKEENVYKRVIDLHMESEYSKKFEVHSLEKLLSKCNTPDEFIWYARVFCIWDKTSEGDNFWWFMSSLWRGICIFENLFEYKNSTLLGDKCRWLWSNTCNLAESDMVHISEENRKRITDLRTKLLIKIKEYEKE